jgi:hypothetical protein
VREEFPVKDREKDPQGMMRMVRRKVAGQMRRKSPFPDDIHHNKKVYMD